MPAFELAPTQWAALGVVVIVQVLATGLLWWRIARQDRRLLALHEHLSKPSDTVPASALINVMGRIEQGMQRMQEVQVPTGPAAAPAQDKSYELAQRLARQGASAQQIVDACGISLNETELILRMHAPH